MTQNQHYILWAEDDPDDMELFTEVFDQLYPHIQIIHAKNGKEAFETLRHLKLLPDLIILDLNMPVLSGKDTISLIRNYAEYNQLPIFVLTTSTNENEQEFFDQHQVAMLTKPTKIAEVKNVVEFLESQLKSLIIQRDNH